MDDYRTQGLDVDTYFSTRFRCPGNQDDFEHKMREFGFQNLHQFFQSLSTTTTDLKVLDYGCGPVVANVISAARVATEIVFAEYTEEGRSAVQQWLKKDPKAFDWSLYCEYIVQKLENGSLQEAKMREKQIYNIAKAVVHCDIAQDPPIETGYEGPYDVVICCLSIGNVSKTNEDFEEEIRKIAALVKSGKHLLMQIVTSKNMNEPFIQYYIGDKKYSKKRVSRAFIQATLEKYFDQIDVSKFSIDTVKQEMPECTEVLFVTARKI